MGNYYCIGCQQLLDVSLFNETDEYHCIGCLDGERKDVVKEREDIKESKSVIKELEMELERIKSNESKKYIKGIGFIEDKPKTNDINTEYLEDIYFIVNEISFKLDHFISETRDTLNAILEKYNLTDKTSKAKLLNYEDSTINLREALNIYYCLDKSEFKKVILDVYNLTHKNELTSFNTKVKEWSNKYPDIVNRKISSIQKKLKQANLDPKKSREMKERYYSEKMIGFRLPTIRKMLDARGHLNISDYSIESALKSNCKMENEEIMNDLIANKNDNPDNDIDIESEYKQKEPSTFDYLGSYTNPNTLNTKDILNRG